MFRLSSSDGAVCKKSELSYPGTRGAPAVVNLWCTLPPTPLLAELGRNQETL